MLTFFKKRDKKPTPPWLTWLMVIFVVYVFVANQQKASPVHKAIENAGEKLSAQKFLNIEDYKSKIFGDASGTLQIKDVSLGSGQPTVCGQEATVTFDATLVGGKAVESADEKKPFAFRIGAGKAMPVFEQGIIGMQPGGVRSLIAPPAMAYGIKEFARDDVPTKAQVKFDVKLIKADPALPDFSAAPYRITTVSAGSGPFLLCGQEATVQVALWSVDGKKLYMSEKPITFTPGKSEVFLGLEQGVIGMNMNAARTLIVPPAFQKTMNGNAPAIPFPLPKNQTVLVDVVLVP